MARERIKFDPSGYPILVVDDQDETLISSKLLLEREGHRVLTAVDGREALSLISDEQFDLIVVDYFMPQMNCEELVRAIRNIDSDVQIILQTGYSGEKPPRQMLQLLDIQGYHDKLDAGVHQRCAGVNTAARGHRLIHLGDDPLVNMRRRRTNEDPAGL